MIREQVGIGDWRFAFREMDLAEEREQAEVANLYAEMNGWTADEIRAQQGLGPLEPETSTDGPQDED